MKEQDSCNMKEFENDNQLCIGNVTLAKDSNLLRLIRREEKTNTFFMVKNKLKKENNKLTNIDHPVQHIKQFEYSKK